MKGFDMAYAEPDFSDVEVGDRVYHYGLHGWLEGVVIFAGKRLINVQFTEGDKIWTFYFHYNGTRDHDYIAELFWKPLPIPPQECLRSPRRMATHG